MRIIDVIYIIYGFITLIVLGFLFRLYNTALATWMFFFRNLSTEQLIGVWMIATLFVVLYMMLRMPDVDEMMKDYFKRKDLNVDDVIEFYRKTVKK